MHRSEVHERKWHKRTSSACCSNARSTERSSSSSSDDAQELAEGWLPVRRHTSDATFLAIASAAAATTSTTRSSATPCAPAATAQASLTPLAVVTSAQAPHDAIGEAAHDDARLGSAAPLPSAAPTCLSAATAVVVVVEAVAAQPCTSSSVAACPPYAAELLHVYARQLDDAMLDEMTWTWQHVLREALPRRAWLVWRFGRDACDVQRAGDFLSRLVRRYDLRLPALPICLWAVHTRRSSCSSSSGGEGTMSGEDMRDARWAAAVQDVVRVVKAFACTSVSAPSSSTAAAASNTRDAPDKVLLLLLQCLRYLRRLAKCGAGGFVCDVLFTSTYNANSARAVSSGNMTRPCEDVSLWQWLQAYLAVLDVSASSRVQPCTTSLLSVVRVRRRWRVRLVTAALVTMQSLLHVMHARRQDVVCAMVRTSKTRLAMTAAPHMGVVPAVPYSATRRHVPLSVACWIYGVSYCMRDAVQALCNDDHDGFALTAHKAHWHLLLLGCTHVSTLITVLFERPLPPHVALHDVSGAAHALVKHMAAARLVETLVRLLHLPPSQPDCPAELRPRALRLVLQVMFYAVFVCVGKTGASHKAKRNAMRRCLAVWRTPCLFDVLCAVLARGNDAVQALLAANLATTSAAATATNALVTHGQGGNSCNNASNNGSGGLYLSAHIASEARQHTNNSSLVRETSQRMNMAVGMSGRSVTNDTFELTIQPPAPSQPPPAVVVQQPQQQQQVHEADTTAGTLGVNGDVQRSATSSSLLGNRTPSQTHDDTSTSGLSGLPNASHELLSASGLAHHNNNNNNTTTVSSSSCVVYEELHVARCHCYGGAVRAMAVVLQCVQQVLLLSDGTARAWQVELLQVMLRSLGKSHMLLELQRLLGLVAGPFSGLGESYKRSRSSADALEQSCLLRPRVALPNHALRHLLHHIVYAERASVAVLHGLLERLPQHACGPLAHVSLQRALKAYVEHVSSAYLTENLSRRSVATLGDALDCLRILCSETATGADNATPHRPEELRQAAGTDVWAETRTVPAAARLSLSQSMNSNVSTSHTLSATTASGPMNPAQPFPLRSPSLTPSIPVTSTYLISSSFSSATASAQAARRQGSLSASVMAPYYSERGHAPVMANTAQANVVSAIAAAAHGGGVCGGATRATLVIEDGKFVSVLARMVSRPVVSCQHVPLRALHLINRILTCPTCPAARRLGLMIHTRYVLSSLITTMTGRDWAVLQDPPHLADTTAIASATAHNNNNKNNNNNAAAIVSAGVQEQSASRAAQLRSCAWVQQELQVNCVRLVRRWLSATRVPTRAASTTWGPRCVPADFLTALLKSTLFLPFIERTLTLGVRTVRQVSAEAELEEDNNNNMTTSQPEERGEKAGMAAVGHKGAEGSEEAEQGGQPDIAPCYVAQVMRQLGMEGGDDKEEAGSTVGDAPLWWRARQSNSSQAVSRRPSSGAAQTRPDLASSTTNANSSSSGVHEQMGAGEGKTGNGARKTQAEPPVMSSTAFELRLLHEVLLLLQEVAVSAQLTSSTSPSSSSGNAPSGAPREEERAACCTTTLSLLMDSPVLLVRLVELFQTALTRQLEALQQGSYPYTSHPIVVSARCTRCETRNARSIPSIGKAAACRNYELFLLVLETLATMLGYDKATMCGNVAERPEAERAAASQPAASLHGSPDDQVLHGTSNETTQAHAMQSTTATLPALEANNALTSEDHRRTMSVRDEASHDDPHHPPDQVLVDTFYTSFYTTHYRGGAQWHHSLFGSHSSNNNMNEDEEGEEDMTDDSSRTTNSGSRRSTSNGPRTADYASASHTRHQTSREDNNTNNISNNDIVNNTVAARTALAGYRTPPPPSLTAAQHAMHPVAPTGEPAVPQGRATTFVSTRPATQQQQQQQQQQPATTTTTTGTAAANSNSGCSSPVGKLCATMDVHLLDDYLRGVWVWLQRNASKECGSLYLQGGSEACVQQQQQLQQSYNEGTHGAASSSCGCCCHEGRAMEMSCLGLGASVRGESATASVAARLTRASDRVRFLIKLMKRCRCNAASS